MKWISRSAVLSCGLMVAVGCAPKAEEVVPAVTTLETDDHQALYAIGQILAQNASELALSEDDLTYVELGFRDKVLGNEPMLDAQEVAPKVQAFAQGRAEAAAAAEKTSGEEFVAAAAAVENATRTESGIVYELVVEGDGATPTATDSVRVHYTGTLRDGTVFDSSVDRGEPVEFPLNQVVPCWTEGLQLMKVGGKSKLTCPSDQAYGDAGRPPAIPGGATLVFDVELLEITTTP